jgi:hypothetical protein
MKLPDWRNKSPSERVLLIATVAVMALLALHPELRLLIPVLDALGIDLLILLVSSQLWSHVKPALLAASRPVVLLLSRKSYSIAIFCFGHGGPYVHAKLSIRFPQLGFAA